MSFPGNISNVKLPKYCYIRKDKAEAKARELAKKYANNAFIVQPYYIEGINRHPYIIRRAV